MIGGEEKDNSNVLIIIIIIVVGIISAGVYYYQQQKDKNTDELNKKIDKSNKQQKEKHDKKNKEEKEKRKTEYETLHNDVKKYLPGLDEFKKFIPQHRAQNNLYLRNELTLQFYDKYYIKNRTLCNSLTDNSSDYAKYIILKKEFDNDNALKYINICRSFVHNDADIKKMYNNYKSNTTFIDSKKCMNLSINRYNKYINDVNGKNVDEKIPILNVLLKDLKNLIEQNNCESNMNDIITKSRQNIPENKLYTDYLLSLNDKERNFLKFIKSKLSPNIISKLDKEIVATEPTTDNNKKNSQRSKYTQGFF